MTDAAALMIARACHILEREFRGSPPECCIPAPQLAEGLDTANGAIAEFYEWFVAPRPAPEADWDVSIQNDVVRFRMKGRVYPNA